MTKHKKIIFLAICLMVLFTACGSGHDDDFSPLEPAALGAVPAPDAVTAGEAVMDFDGALRGRESVPVPQGEANISLFPDTADFDNDALMPEELLPAAPTAWQTPDMPLPQTIERRVIRNADISVDTLYFEDSASELERIVNQNNGFVENSALQLADRRGYDRQFWYAHYVIRVPVARFDEVNRQITQLGMVAHFTTSSEDVTMMFLDMQSRLSIREEEERRVEAMREAATEINDILALERQLSDLRLLIDSYRRRMTEIDQLAAFSTIRLTLREVEEIEEEEDYEEEEEYIPYYYPTDDGGFGTRISTAFSASVDFSVMLFENIAVVLATIALPLLVLAIPAFGGFMVYKKYVLKRSIT